MVFRITTDQMQAAPIPDDRFAEWFCHELLMNERPDFWVDLGPEICLSYTITGRRYAEHFGIRRPDLQAQYVMLMWQLAPNLHETPGFKEILQSRLPEVDKVEALWSVDETVANEAIARADMLHWTPEEVPGNVLGIEVEDLSELYAQFPFLQPQGSGGN